MSGKPNEPSKYFTETQARIRNCRSKKCLDELEQELQAKLRAVKVS